MSMPIGACRFLSPRIVQHGLGGCLGLLLCASAAAQRPLGCDVSGYQPSVNWTQLTNAGVKFAWAKATEGTYYLNPYFTSQESGAKGAGVYIGAYHYARPSADPGTNGADTEATYFWNTAGNYVKSGGAYLVPMLDWEDVEATNQFSAATMSAWVNEWCNSVSNKAAAAGVVGVRPVVYTGTWYSEPSGTYSGLTSAVTNWANWMSDYPSSPNPQTGSPSGYTYPWPSWNIWQYDDTNTSVPNWTGGDVDVFNGNLAGFIQMFVIGGTNAPYLTTPLTNITVAVGSNATFAVRASGQPPLSFKWLFDGQIIPGATSSNYTIAKAQLANAGGYAVSVSNGYANIASSTVFLSVLAPLTNATGSILAPPNLVNWWTADGNGVDIYGGNNATPTGGLSYTNGEVNLAFHFDGATSYLTPATSTKLPPNWTLCLWINRQNAPGVSAALVGDTTNALKLEQYDATREVGISESGVADYLFIPAYSVPAGVWTHLAFVGTSTSVALYTNGVFEGSVSVSNFSLPRAALGMDLFANDTPTDFLLGSLDEIMTFNSALSAAQIGAIHGAGHAGLVRAPEFTSLVSTNSREIELQLEGLTGKNINVLTSTDLLTWTTLKSVANPNGATNYIATTTTNAYQFFRASQ